MSRLMAGSRVMHLEGASNWLRDVVTDGAIQAATCQGEESEQEKPAQHIRLHIIKWHFGCERKERRHLRAKKTKVRI